jgi:hypothetical protein
MEYQTMGTIQKSCSGMTLQCKAFVTNLIKIGQLGEKLLRETDTKKNKIIFSPRKGSKRNV